MKFKNQNHEERYVGILGRMKSDDCYHRSLAYLLALDGNITDSRIKDCFDFNEDCIKPVDAAWITGFDRRVLMLAAHLWNSANVINLDDVFGSDDIYLLEAIRIRFEF